MSNIDNLRPKIQHETNVPRPLVLRPEVVARAILNTETSVESMPADPERPAGLFTTSYAAARAAVVGQVAASEPVEPKQTILDEPESTLDPIRLQLIVDELATSKDLKNYDDLQKAA